MTNDNRQALLDKLLDYLQSPLPPPEYLGEPPESAPAFDPYQMVSEWIALRQEMKQQGKLLQTAQERLQRELEAARSQNEQLQKRLEASQQQVSVQYASEFAAQEKRFEKAQENFLKAILGVLDALDRACAHWQESSSLEMPLSSPSQSWRGKLGRWLSRLGQKLSSDSTTSAPTALMETLESDRQGVELIRRTLLDILKQQQVVPIVAQGQPFDPQRMYAIGRQESDEPENTVIQEVVRGYLWRERILRETQAIVSAGNNTSR
ncbi:nucleotide exchange factor GrpE [Chroococcidiopsis sp. FACHB-1243]|uniref:nucleotide exchange factor GrpE n=1 Tax=Chroococcidiopsis sp. [FACHB-1243] TaxID=2692781 RepID=UPI00177EDBA3|nr:nucleotide exchange factor GrpE [Chroococcidiopsis sp. [FACHB-1243]]MBD2304966.1 nucleotide exchange factor GrpE [Chroococcidiopsis sp. [FACHB-1243]]